MPAATSNAVGTVKSKGSACGRVVFQGPRGGLFYLSSGGNKVYIPESKVQFYASGDPSSAAAARPTGTAPDYSPQALERTASENLRNMDVVAFKKLWQIPDVVLDAIKTSDSKNVLLLDWVSTVVRISEPASYFTDLVLDSSEAGVLSTTYGGFFAGEQATYFADDNKRSATGAIQDIPGDPLTYTDHMNLKSGKISTDLKAHFRNGNTGFSLNHRQGLNCLCTGDDSLIKTKFRLHELRSVNSLSRRSVLSNLSVCWIELLHHKTIFAAINNSPFFSEALGITLTIPLQPADKNFENFLASDAYKKSDTKIYVLAEEIRKRLCNRSCVCAKPKCTPGNCLTNLTQNNSALRLFGSKATAALLEEVLFATQHPAQDGGRLVTCMFHPLCRETPLSWDAFVQHVSDAHGYDNVLALAFAMDDHASKVAQNPLFRSKAVDRHMYQFYNRKDWSASVFWCSICFREFTGADKLHDHIVHDHRHLCKSIPADKISASIKIMRCFDLQHAYLPRGRKSATVPLCILTNPCDRIQQRIEFQKRRHVGSEPFMCPKCSMTAHRVEIIETHVNVYHGANDVSRSFILVDDMFYQKNSIVEPLQGVTYSTPQELAKLQSPASVYSSPSSPTPGSPLLKVGVVDHPVKHELFHGLTQEGNVTQPAGTIASVFDDHGTNVTAILGCEIGLWQLNSAEGVKGEIIPASGVPVRIICYRWNWETAVGGVFFRDDASIADCIYSAVSDQCRLINLSLQFNGAPYGHTLLAVKEAYLHHVVCVFAAGNAVESSDKKWWLSPCKIYPPNNVDPAVTVMSVGNDYNHCWQWRPSPNPSGLAPRLAFHSRLPIDADNSVWRTYGHGEITAEECNQANATLQCPRVADRFVFANGVLCKSLNNDGLIVFPIGTSFATPKVTGGLTRWLLGGNSLWPTVEPKEALRQQRDIHGNRMLSQNIVVYQYSPDDDQDNANRRIVGDVLLR